MKAIQVPTDRYTDKQMWHIHKREYYSALKKKGHYDTQYNMDEL